MPVQSKISMVYWIASKMGRFMDYKTAQRVAGHFTDAELTRIYLAIWGEFMYTTYYIELSDGQFINWFNRLKDAKAFGERTFDEFRIVTVKGQYRYEGAHTKIREYTCGSYRVIK